MDEPVRYIKCSLQKKSRGMSLIKLAWVPVEYAVSGNLVNINNNGKLEKRWEVVSATGLETDDIEDTLLAIATKN